MRQWPVILKEIAACFLFLFLLLSLVGCSREQAESTPVETGGYKQDVLYNIKITAGDAVLYGAIFDNETAQDFSELLPLTVSLWRPADFAKAFYLDTELIVPEERTWEYLQGGLAYWPEGPAVAIFHGADRERTVVPVVIMGKLDGNVDVFVDYMGEITIESETQ